MLRQHFFAVKMPVIPTTILVQPKKHSLICRGFITIKYFYFCFEFVNSGWIYVYNFISKVGYLLVDKGYTRNIYFHRPFFLGFVVAISPIMHSFSPPFTNDTPFNEAQRENKRGRGNI